MTSVVHAGREQVACGDEGERIYDKAMELLQLQNCQPAVVDAALGIAAVMIASEKLTSKEPQEEISFGHGGSW